MKIIGLTGGIGSGKSKVLNEFRSLGVPCYESDKAAKKLMINDQDLINQIKSIFGSDVYIGNELNSKKIATLVFNNIDKLSILNSIVHPKVAADFKSFSSKQKGPYIIKEAAILIESEAYKNCDLIILVTAPKSYRVDRIFRRDGTTYKDIYERMRNQWNDEKKIPYADFIIDNKVWKKTTLQITDIHQKLLTQFHKQ